MERSLSYKDRVEALIESGKLNRRTPVLEDPHSDHSVRHESWEYKDPDDEYSVILGRAVGEDLGCDIRTYTLSGGLWLIEDFEIYYKEGLVAQNINYAVPFCERGVDQNQLFYPIGQQRHRRVPVHLIEEKTNLEVVTNFKRGADRVLTSLERRLGLVTPQLPQS